MSHAAGAICANLQRGNEAAVPTWAALKQHTAHLRSAIVACHPLIASDAPLDSILPKLPKCVGLHAVRSRLHRGQEDNGMPCPVLELSTMSRTVVTELPALLPALTEARSISMGSQQGSMTQPGGKCASLLAAVVCEMTWLQALSLQRVGAPQDSLVKVAAMTQLKWLYFSCQAMPNDIINETVPGILAGLTGLQCLRLRYGGEFAMRQRVMGGFAKANIPDLATLQSLPALTQLTYLQVSTWCISDEDTIALSGALRSLSGLAALDLSFLKVDSVHWPTVHNAQMQLADAIAACAGLTLLSLKSWQNNAALQAAAGSAHPVAHAIAGLPHLARLNVDNDLVDALDGEGLLDFSGVRAAALEALAPCAPALRFLDISNLGAFPGRVAAEQAGRNLGKAGNLQSLWLSDHKTLMAGRRGERPAELRMRHGFCMAAAAPQLPALRQLQMVGIGLEGDGLVAFAEALTHLEALTMLVMASSHCGCERGCAALATALRHMPQLRVLDMSGSTDNKVPCARASAEALAAAMPHISELRVLSIGGLRLSGAQGALFVRACAALPHLLMLQLRGNPLGSGAAAFTEECEACLDQFACLKLLALDEAGLPAAQVRRVRDAWLGTTDREVTVVGDVLMRGQLLDAEEKLMRPESVFQRYWAPGQE